ncbi:hypothetical protein OV079_33635 [Nannocystis pusilla]|uniref:Uncharacterized protein n=1 Tax=Nannocystis pusilla TaxID=889268 RepID=A0A9X3EW46_9BACT|nr:hypothetical protein [Nannocystis pusilla]MCY1010425.1 hypothetical protein [Nannocystis pusilla]
MSAAISIAANTGCLIDTSASFTAGPRGRGPLALGAGDGLGLLGLLGGLGGGGGDLGGRRGQLDLDVHAGAQQVVGVVDVGDDLDRARLRVDGRLDAHDGGAAGQLERAEVGGDRLTLADGLERGLGDPRAQLDDRLVLHDHHDGRRHHRHRLADVLELLGDDAVDRGGDGRVAAVAPGHRQGDLGLGDAVARRGEGVLGPLEHGGGDAAALGQLALALELALGVVAADGRGLQGGLGLGDAEAAGAGVEAEQQLALLDPLALLHHHVDQSAAHARAEVGAVLRQSSGDVAAGGAGDGRTGGDALLGPRRRTRDPGRVSPVGRPRGRQPDLRLVAAVTREWKEQRRPEQQAREVHGCHGAGRLNW